MIKAFKPSKHFLQEAGPSQQHMEGQGVVQDDEGLVSRRAQGEHSSDVVAAGGLGYLATAEEAYPQGALSPPSV